MRLGGKYEADVHDKLLQLLPCLILQSEIYIIERFVKETCEIVAEAFQAQEGGEIEMSQDAKDMVLDGRAVAEWIMLDNVGPYRFERCIDGCEMEQSNGVEARGICMRGEGKREMGYDETVEKRMYRSRQISRSAFVQA